MRSTAPTSTAPRADQSFITGTGVPNGVADDGRHVYWTNDDHNAIGRANLDGTGVNETFVTGANHPFGVAVDAGGTTGLAKQGISQVVFVHGINASCQVAGASDYKAMHDALAGQGMGVYTFCYDHDIGFGSGACSKSPPSHSCQPIREDRRCFSDTSRGEPGIVASVAGRARLTSALHIGPLFVSTDKPGAGPTDDGDSPLAFDAAKLDACLALMVKHDVITYGHELPITVIGNSMGMAITRGWLELAKDTDHRTLGSVTTVVSLEGATEGSWLAAAGQGLDTSLA